MNKIALFLTLAVVFCGLIVASVQAQSTVTDWNTTFGSDGTSEGGFGLFSGGLNIITGQIGITSDQFIPIVTDLDNDGINEIIVIDGTTLKVFQNLTVISIDSISTGFTFPTAPFIVFDYDGDGSKEVLVAGQPITANDTTENKIRVYNLSNGDLQLESTLTYPSELDLYEKFQADHVEVAIQCAEINRCLLLFNPSGTVNADQHEIKATGFSSTGFGSVITIHTPPSSNTDFGCFPIPNHISVGDFNDSNKENFIFTLINVEDAGNDVGESSLYYVGVNSLLTPNVHNIANNSDVATFSGDVSITTCDGEFTSGQFTGQIGHVLTSPTVDFFDTGSNDVSIYGIITSDDTFKMVSYDESGSFKRDDPSLIDGSGLLVSNVFKGCFFPDTCAQNRQLDYCVAGYNKNGDSMDIVCSSFGTGESNLGLGLGGKSKGYSVNTTELYNVSNAYDDWHNYGASADHDDTKYAGQKTTGFSAISLDEAITPYGVFRLNFEDTTNCNFGFCSATQVFSRPIDESGSLYSMDLDKDGLDELIGFSSSRLSVHSVVSVDNVTIVPDNLITTNPCLDSGAIQINESLSISFTVVDQDAEGFKCGYEWKYKGTRKFCTCPNCFRNMATDRKKTRLKNIMGL